MGLSNLKINLMILKCAEYDGSLSRSGEMVDAHVSDTCGEICGGSTPLSGT